MVEGEEARRIAGLVGSMLGALDGLSPFGQLLTAAEAGQLRVLLRAARDCAAGWAEAHENRSAAAALVVEHRRFADAILAVAIGGSWAGGVPNLRGLLLNRLCDCKHPYLNHCEEQTPREAPAVLLQVMCRDLQCAQVLANPPWGFWLQLTDMDADIAIESIAADGEEPGVVGDLKERFAHCGDWQGLAEELGWMVHESGRGTLRRFRAFRLACGEKRASLEPIRHFADFPLGWLEGHESRIEILEENTLSFLAGHRAHNVLIWGPRGGGKSTLIRALIGKYFHRGLRAVEINPSCYERLPDLFALVRGRRQRFIGVLDNLSLERGDETLHILSRVLDGNLEAWPSNLVCYATSNYKDLVDREGERSQGLGQLQMDGQPSQLVNQFIQPEFYDPQQLQRLDEERALDDRFALKIFLDLPCKQQYQAMVLSYARRAGIAAAAEDLLAAFDIWRMRHNHDLVGGRTARDFVLAYLPQYLRREED